MYLFDVAPYSLCVTLQLPLLVTSPQLKQLVRPAVERSVQELLPPVVERSIKIALTTCEQIVKKVSRSVDQRPNDSIRRVLYDILCVFAVVESYGDTRENKHTI